MLQMTLQNKITVSRNYAIAILKIAIEDNTVDDWHKKLILFSEFLELKIVKRFFFSNKFIEKIFFSVFENKINRKFKNLILNLSKNNRFSIVSNILKEFNFLKDIYEKTIEVIVVSAFKIEKSISNKIYLALVKKFSEKIRLRYQIDSSIIGGLVLILNNKKIDFSISSKIKQLNNFLNN